MNRLKIQLLIIVTFIISFSSIANAQNDGKINWLTIEEAQELGKDDPRKVFIDVYTDWCGWCKRMDASTFSDEEVVNYVNENYYAVKLNAESSNKISFNGIELTEQELAKAFRVSGYPTIVFIDETFQKITPLPGYRKADEFKDILVQFNKANL